MPIYRPRSAPTRTGERRGRLGNSQNVRFKTDDFSFFPRAAGRGTSPDSENDETEEEGVRSRCDLSPRAADISGLAYLEEDHDSGGKAKWWHVSDRRIQELVKCLSEGAAARPALDIGDASVSEADIFASKTSSVAATTGISPPENVGAPSCTCRSMLATNKVCKDPLADWPPDKASKVEATSQCLGATWPLDASILMNLSSPGLPALGATSLASSVKTLPPYDFSRPTSPWAPMRHDALLNQLREDLALQREEIDDATKLPRSPSPIASRRARGRVSFGALGRSAPIPCPNSGKRHGGLRWATDELIDIDLYFHEDSDRVTLRLHPDTRIGPDQPSLGNTAKATANTASAGAMPSLKGLIFQMTGIEPSAQRLLCRSFDVSMDQMTLRTYGISNGQTVMVHQKVFRAAGRKQPLLACTAKTAEKLERREQKLQRMAAMLRDRPNSPWFMPKWFVPELCQGL